MYLLISVAREKDSRFSMNSTELEIEYKSFSYQDVMAKLLELDDSPLESRIASMITTGGDFDDYDYDDKEKALKENFEIEFFIKEYNI